MSKKDVLTGLLLGAVTIMLFQFQRILKKKNKYKDAYWAERRGRARVEKEMKKIADIRLNTQEGFFVQPIGEISSCYRQCIGTPRQGLLVPSSRASITLVKNISPESIEGLEKFSHVWITFKFHLNSNILKESKAFQSRSTFTGKIAPPMLKGKKVGVFATRSPHRPNPVGITLAKVRSIDKVKRTIYLYACDLVHGTPVLDVKPYVPTYDNSPDSYVAEWIHETVETRNEVVFDQKALAQLERMKRKLSQYKNEPEEFVKALRETLEAEVRSKFQTKKQMEFSSKGMPVEVLFDETIVRYNWVEERKFEVIDITLAKEDPTRLAEIQKLESALINDKDTKDENEDEIEKLENPQYEINDDASELTPLDETLNA